MNARFWVVLISALLVTSLGCDGVLSDGAAPDESTLTSSPAETLLEKQSRAACERRWDLGQSVPSARSISYASASAQCASGAQSGAVKLGAFIRQHFSAYMDLDVPGNGVQIYNCRAVRGGRSNSVHGDGRAIDIFIPTLPGGVADNTKGDRIANWLAENAAEIGIQYIIWDRGSFRADRNPQNNCYGGTHPHNDHIHIELSWAAAREQTPFFMADTEQEIPDAVSDPADSEPNPPAEEEPQSNSPPPETPSNGGTPEPAPTSTANAWLGEPCDSDAQCMRSNDIPSSCVIPPGTRWGFCSVSCDGLCPDRAGHAETFCARASMVGLPDMGMCMAKAQSQNGYCASYPDFVAFSAERFVEASGVQSRSATVCAVSRPLSVVSEDQTAEEAQALCGDGSLPVSDHGRTCAAMDENQWRCACSERYETTVSQVCRDGAWINYDLNPRDCSRCDGNYSSGCDP